MVLLYIASFSLSKISCQLILITVLLNKAFLICLIYNVVINIQMKWLDCKKNKKQNSARNADTPKLVCIFRTRLYCNAQTIMGTGCRLFLVTTKTFWYKFLIGLLIVWLSAWNFSVSLGTTESYYVLKGFEPLPSFLFPK